MEELLNMLVFIRLHHGELSVACRKELMVHLEDLADWELKEVFAVFRDLMCLTDDHMRKEVT